MLHVMIKLPPIAFAGNIAIFSGYFMPIARPGKHIICIRRYRRFEHHAGRRWLPAVAYCAKSGAD